LALFIQGWLYLVFNTFVIYAMPVGASMGQRMYFLAVNRVIKLRGEAMGTRQKASFTSVPPSFIPEPGKRSPISGANKIYRLED